MWQSWRNLSRTRHIFIIMHNLNILYAFVSRCLSRGIEERRDFFSPDHDVIAGSVSQNCGRQPHIVSTNHSNLIAVGPNRSLASRQAIVWTYRPRVEATESQPPDFLWLESHTDLEEKRTSSPLRFSIFSFEIPSRRLEDNRRSENRV